MKIAQCTIINGNSSQVAWLDKVDQLRVGCRVTLKDSPEPERLWTVNSIGKADDSKEVTVGIGKRSQTWFNTDFVRKDGSWKNASGN